MSPAAKTFLVSGFPRSMRDVVEYTNKVTIEIKLLFIFRIVLSYIHITYYVTS